MAIPRFRFPNMGARELNDFTSWDTISRGVSGAASNTRKFVQNFGEARDIYASNAEGGDRIRYGHFTAAIGGIKGLIGGQAGQKVDAGIASLLQKLESAGGHKIGGADLSKAIGDLRKEIEQVSSTLGGSQGNILKDFTNTLKNLETKTARGGVGALGGGTRDSIKAAFGLKADNSIETARKQMAEEIKNAGKSLSSVGLKLSLDRVVREMERLSASAKDAAEKQRILANAQKRINSLARGTVGGPDREILEGLAKSSGKNVGELQKALLGQASTRKGLEFSNRVAQLTHAIGGATRYLIPLKRTLDVGNTIFQNVNSKFNQFARMQMRVSAERGTFGRQVRGAGINYGHMMTAIGAGRSAGMEDRQVIGQMAGLQTQLAQARWGEGGLAENVGRWGISVYNGAGGVKEAHDLMIDFSRKLKSLGTNMEKLQFLHAIGRRPEEMEYVANYEKQAKRMEWLKQNPHMQGILDKADILDETGFSAKADAATKIELRRREILNQNAIDEGIIPGLIRSLNPENWLFSDWTARRKGVAAAREELSGNKATRALEAMLSEMRKKGAKQGGDFLSGFTISDIIALAGGQGGWADQDKEEKGTQSFVVDLEAAFERMSGYSADTRTNLEKLGDGLLSVVKKVVDLFSGLLQFTEKNPMLGTAAVAAGGVGALWGAGKLVKGGLGWLGKALGIGGGAGAAGAGKALGKIKPKGGLGGILTTVLLAAGLVASKSASGEEEAEGAAGGGGRTGAPPLPPGPWNEWGGGAAAAGGEMLEGMVGGAGAAEELSETEKQKQKEEKKRKSEELRKKNADRARSKPTGESGGWWEITKAALSGFVVGAAKGLGKGVNSFGHAITLGLWDGPFSKETVDLGYEDWMTRTGDVFSTIGGNSLALAATMGMGGLLRGGVKAGSAAVKAGAKGLLNKGGKELGKGVVTIGAPKFTKKRAANIMKNELAEATKLSNNKGMVALTAVGTASTVAGQVSGKGAPGVGIEGGTGGTAAAGGGAGGAGGASGGGGTPRATQGTNFVSGSGGSLTNLIKPIRDMVRKGASYELLSQVLGQHGMDLPDMSVLQSKDFLTDDSKAMETLKGLGYANIQRRGTEKYGKPMDLANFLKNITDDIAVTYKNAGGIMTDEEIIQTFGRQEAGAKDVSRSMMDTYVARGDELGIGAREKMALRVNRIGKEHKDWDQNKVRAEAKKEQRQEFIKGLTKQQLEMYGSQGGEITDPAEIARRAEALFMDAGMTRSESQKMTHEQVADFAKFRNENRNIGLAQVIARFSNQTGLSKDVLRNNLIHGKTFNEMSEEDQKEYMKGTEYRTEQKKKRAADRMSARKAQRAEAAKNVSEEEAAKYLGDEGDAKEFISLRNRVQNGEKLSEADQKAYENYTDKVGRKAGGDRRAKKYKPLNAPYKPTAAEQADIDAADKESARLVKKQKRAKKMRPLAEYSDIRYMGSLIERGGIADDDKELEKHFGKERVRQFRRAQRDGTLGHLMNGDHYKDVKGQKKRNKPQMSREDAEKNFRAMAESNFRQKEGESDEDYKKRIDETVASNMELYDTLHPQKKGKAGGKGPGSAEAASAAAAGATGATGAMESSQAKVEQAAHKMADNGAAANAAAASAKDVQGAAGGSVEKNITINMGGQTINQNINGEHSMDAEGMKRGTMQGASEIRNLTAEDVASVAEHTGDL